MNLPKLEEDEDVKAQLASSPPSQYAALPPEDEKPQLGKRAHSPPAQELFRPKASESGSPEKKVKTEGVMAEPKQRRGGESDDEYKEDDDKEEFEITEGPRVVPPANRVGREVSWPRNVKLCTTGTVKDIYKLSLPYLNTLDYEESRSSAGWRMKLFSEHQVQQAAFDQRGGEMYFRAYFQRLHNTALTKAMNAKKLGKSSKFPPELDETERPLAYVPYEKEDVPDNWDNYRPAPGRKRRAYYGGCCG